MEKLRAVFRDDVDMVKSHGEVNHQAIKVSVHKARTARFIHEYREDWSTAVHDATLSAKPNWHELPGIDELPGAVVPTWAKIFATLTLVGWSTSTFTRNRSHLVKKEGVRSNVRAGMKTPLSLLRLGLPARMPVRAKGESVKVPPRSGRQIPGTEGKRRRRQWGRTKETQGWCSHGTERFRVGRRRRERKRWKLC